MTKFELSETILMRVINFLRTVETKRDFQVAAAKLEMELWKVILQKEKENN